MLKTNQKITRYEYETETDLYYIDIIETAVDYDAWITKWNCGFSSFMFGVLKEQETKAQFLAMVEALADEYIETYEEELAEIEERI